MATKEMQKKFQEEILSFLPQLKVVIRDILPDERNVEEVGQDVLLRAWQNFDRLPTDEVCLKAWLFKTAKRRSIDYYRRLKRQNRFEDYSGYDLTGLNQVCEDAKPLPHAVCEPATSDTLVDPYLVRAVRKFLFGLPSTHRQTLVLAASGFRYDEIAQATSSSPGTVRSRLFYTRCKAQRLLGGYL